MGEFYSTVLYDSTNGLPTSESNAIAETEEGFIWVGGYSGLVRYDGINFERINPKEGITSVVSLYVDSKNRLWIGTNDAGIGVYDGQEFTFFNKGIGQSDNLKSLSIKAITEDKDGNIIIGTTHGMGYIDNDMKLHSINISQLNEEYICELRSDNNGIIYGVTNDGSLFTYQDGKMTNLLSGQKLNIGYIRSVLPDPNNPGYVYIGTEDSYIYYGSLEDKFKNRSTIDVSPLTTINSIEYIDGVKWICADNGIGMLTDENFIVLKNIPMDKSIGHMMADYEGNVWFTSTRQGLMKVVPNEFVDIQYKNELDTMIVNSTCIYNKTLLLGTDSGLTQTYIKNESEKINKLPIRTCTNAKSREIIGTYKNMVDLMKGVRIRNIFKDSNNILWFSTFSDLGLVKYDDGNVTIYDEGDGLPSTKVRAVSERSDGKLMVALTGGFVIHDGKEVIDSYGPDEGLINTAILTVCEGDNGKMLLGSDGDGIYVIDSGSISKIGLSEGLKSEVILRIIPDRNRGLYWIVTSNSIAYLKDGNIQTIDNFPYTNNFDMYENANGNMWVLSSNGIYVAETEDLLANKELDYAFYNINSGLPCVATANSYSYLDDDGVLYISGSTGAFSVNINDFSERISDIKMAIPYVDVDGQTIYPDENGIINIPSHVKRITIYPFVFSYSLKNPKISYQLNGFDDEEITVERDELKPISYTNLSGGRYNFTMVLKSNITEEERSISLVIDKKRLLYEYNWGKFLIALIGLLIVAGLTGLYFHRKTAGLLAKQQENKLFIREMIEAFAKTIDMKDTYTNGHSTRVAEYTKMLAEELGYDDEEVEKFYNIALLHDIGKIGIPPEVLNKPGKLTDQEFNIIKSHSALGYKVLKDISIMPELAVGAGAHHERPDGKGYPKGLKGDEIPRVAQIIAVADTFDAMYSDRPYRKRMNFDKAVSIIKEVSGTQLFPDVVDAFLRLVEKGYFKAEDDDGGGTTEDINNIHKKFDKEEKAREKQNQAEEKKDSIDNTSSEESNSSGNNKKSGDNKKTENNKKSRYNKKSKYNK
ncbi:MAG: HD domain-containing protein [Eubacterium sp.]|nr:HD domain-containing protein [Eubacterium sp.]